MYKNIMELQSIANKKHIPLYRVVLENEMKLSGISEEEVLEKLKERYAIMFQAAHRALKQSLPTVGSLIEGLAKQQNDYQQKNHTICGELINKVMAMALSCSEVNASMGRICAAPTAGASGIIPAVLIAVSEKQGSSEEQILQALLVASGIGAVITKNATVSGAVGGCQAECGVAAAMAAAASVVLAEGTQEMVIHACSLALINAMGLICDPIAGLVQVPCAQRNASQAVNALLSADLALGGMISLIPADEVIEAMYKVGKLLPPQLKETAMGGLAATPTGKAINKKIISEVGKDAHALLEGGQ